VFTAKLHPKIKFVILDLENMEPVHQVNMHEPAATAAQHTRLASRNPADPHNRVCMLALFRNPVAYGDGLALLNSST
jgi:hypothetical protein